MRTASGSRRWPFPRTGPRLCRDHSTRRSKSGVLVLLCELKIAPPWPKLTPAGFCLAGALGLLSEKTNAHSHYVMSVAFSPDGTKIVSGSFDTTIKVWDIINWSRKDHLMFNVTTQQFVLVVLWLNKYCMKFPDDVLDLLIEACLRMR